MATRRALADNPNKVRKPSVLNFQEQRHSIDTDEVTMARINKLVTNRVDEALTDRGRARSKDRQSSDRPCGNSYGRRDGSGSKRDQSAGKGRAYTPTRERTSSDQLAQNRPRSSSRTRACVKCHGQGHFIVDCPSTHWYNRDGTVDVDRDLLEAQRNPNGQKTPPRL